MILNHLSISACSGVLTFDMKIFVKIARLEIGQLFTQGAASDQGLHCLPRSRKRDAKLIWVKLYCHFTTRPECYALYYAGFICRYTACSYIFIHCRLSCR